MQKVQEIIQDNDHLVVMFALEWCNFCWSVRKVLEKFNVSFRSIDIDSVAYKTNDLGGQVFHVLEKMNNWKTLSQIYIGGEFVGGCTDLFDKVMDGSFAARLEKYHIPCDQTVALEPYDFLPTWLHPH